MLKFLTAMFVLIMAGVGMSNTQLPDTLSGPVKGTTLPNRSYVVKDSMVINSGDTLIVSSGDTLYMENDAVTGAAGWIHIMGTFICDGTPTNHNVITTAYVDSAKHPGMWGGIVGDSCKYVEVKNTEVSWAGGNDASGHAYRTFDIYSNYANTTNTVFDSNAVTGVVDDCIGLHGGNASVLQNTLKWCGDPDGDNFNIKDGTVGENASNINRAAGGNGIKVEADPTLPRITNMCIHNNTIVAGGWRRRPEVGFGILVDQSARAEIYNNIFGDNYGDIEITPVADTARTVYQNNLFFYSADSLKGDTVYYPSDGIGKPAANDKLDIQSSALFVKYQANEYAPFTTLDGDNDYHILSNSQAAGTGITPPAPTTSNHWSNPFFGNTTQLPGDANIGALGTGSATAVNSEVSNLPSSYKLNQNYPNPFNPSTVITYSVPKSRLVVLKVYNILGQIVSTLVNRVQNAGNYQVSFNGDNLASGVYFYTLSAGNFKTVKKMILLK